MAGCKGDDNIFRIGQKRPRFRVLYAKKYASLKKYMTAYDLSVKAVKWVVGQFAPDNLGPRQYGRDNLATK